MTLVAFSASYPSHTFAYFSAVCSILSSIPKHYVDRSRRQSKPGFDRAIKASCSNPTGSAQTQSMDLAAFENIAVPQPEICSLGSAENLRRSSSSESLQGNCSEHSHCQLIANSRSSSARRPGPSFLPGHLRARLVIFLFLPAFTKFNISFVYRYR
ncbi:hypothetical protein K438DRAFT_1928084 [Mycena galopus ATCC 62051]|nr:hypothetical protein K438DRAFT_1928084 [Mycena galopus ATCC 62051]